MRNGKFYGPFARAIRIQAPFRQDMLTSSTQAHGGRYCAIYEILAINYRMGFFRNITLDIKQIIPAPIILQHPELRLTAKTTFTHFGFEIFSKICMTHVIKNSTHTDFEEGG